MIKLAKWCKKNGINYRTGWNWAKSNKMPVPFIITPTGTILVDDEVHQPLNDLRECVIYCRVSSNDRKDNLKTQAERCEEFALKRGYNIIKVYKEVASGMNDKRMKLTELLTNIKENQTIIVENKDRLTRFGFNYIELLTSRLGINIVVMNSTDDDKEELMKDFISIVTSFCARIYGLRRRSNMVQKIKEAIIE